MAILKGELQWLNEQLLKEKKKKLNEQCYELSLNGKFLTPSSRLFDGALLRIDGLPYVMYDDICTYIKGTISETSPEVSDNFTGLS